MDTISQFMPGNLAAFIAIYPGDPTNVSPDIFNPPKGALILDSTGQTLRWKTSESGDNSGYQQITGGASGTPSNFIYGGLDASLPLGADVTYFDAFTIFGTLTITGQATFSN